MNEPSCYDKIHNLFNNGLNDNVDIPEHLIHILSKVYNKGYNYLTSDEKNELKTAIELSPKIKWMIWIAKTEYFGTQVWAHYHMRQIERELRVNEQSSLDKIIFVIKGKALIFNEY